MGIAYEDIQGVGGCEMRCSDLVYTRPPFFCDSNGEEVYPEGYSTLLEKLTKEYPIIKDLGAYRKSGTSTIEIVNTMHDLFSFSDFIKEIHEYTGGNSDVMVIYYNASTAMLISWKIRSKINVHPTLLVGVHQRKLWKTMISLLAVEDVIKV